MLLTGSPSIRENGMKFMARRFDTTPRLFVRAVLTVLFPLCVLWSTGIQAQDQQQTEANGAVHVMTLEGGIGPAPADWFKRALDDAAEADAELLVLKLDTPGGLDKSMREMIQALLASPVPVATWVAPEGARAASAGTYILYASHIAAMAPATNLGAATPVQMGGGGGDDGGSPLPFGGPDQGGDEQKQEAPKEKSAMEKKVVNDAVAYIRGLAEKRGRNADWAEQAVREAVSLSSSAALEQNVIDLQAESLSALLEQIDGRTVEVRGGERTLNTADASVTRVEKDWRTNFLSVITDPSVAYILLMIGIYGIILEFYNPGMGVPGVVGAICLLTALYALQMLPVSYVGLGLIVLGIGLMVTEAFTPTFGVLGLGGAVAFIVGSIMLMDTDLPGYQIAMPIIAAFGVASVLILSVVLRLAFKAFRHEVVSGMEGMLHETARALEDFDQEGRVRAMGEMWRARTDTPVREGQILRIRNIDGLTLYVEAQE
jgi:membrane-bound serine protease (ClpP class)